MVEVVLDNRTGSQGVFRRMTEECDMTNGLPLMRADDGTSASGTRAESATGIGNVGEVRLLDAPHYGSSTA